MDSMPLKTVPKMAMGRLAVGAGEYSCTNDRSQKIRSRGF